MMPSVQLAIDLHDVAKTYGSKAHALRGIDMQVYSGEIFGLLGANGAGTTESSIYGTRSHSRVTDIFLKKVVLHNVRSPSGAVQIGADRCDHFLPVLWPLSAHRIALDILV